MPIVSVFVKVEDNDNADIVRSLLVEKGEEVAQQVEPDAFDADNTVSWDIEDE